MRSRLLMEGKIKKSVDWLKDKTKSLFGKLAGKLKGSGTVKTKDVEIGKLVMFSYDPKHKKTLPYYDRYPLAVIIGPAKNGFYGLNLHYLPIQLRAKFFDALVEIGEKYKNRPKKARIMITYANLKSITRLRYFKPCLKHYLDMHVRSKFTVVGREDWEKVLFLPTARFEKASEAQVHKESVKKIG